MGNKELSIQDFAEDDFNDPISLLDAIKRQNSKIDIVDTMEKQSPKMLLSDIEREYWNCQEMCSRRIPKILDRQISGSVMSQPC